ncbi:MAG: hypothetical protein MUF22_05705 [Chitinispirillaceae bacterium]|jgi:hypothetical protein|nr:hypothetical protein [Chitinispirillaceae bacterium]
MKHSVTAVLLAGAGICALLCVCDQGTQKKEKLAKVGSSIITQKDVEAFNMLTRYYPQEIEEFPLGGRPEVSAIVETEALYQKARWNLRNIKLRLGDDWKWKETYFTSLMFTFEIIQKNLGFTDNQLKSYYGSHREEFKGAPPIDSTGKQTGPAEIRPFAEVKAQVAEKLFLSTYKPDSAYVRAAGSADSSAILTGWLDHIRQRAYREFFLKMYYKDQYGSEYPDSLKDIVGARTVISPADMKLILSWIPVYRRDPSLETPAGQKDLATWLVGWKLFAGKSKRTGFASQASTRNILKWAWKLEIAQRYISRELAPRARAAAHVDSAMAVYAYWDQAAAPVTVDTAQLQMTMSQLMTQEIKDRFDGLVYAVRRGRNVRFLQDEWRDELVRKPAALLREADSLRDTGNTSGAENLYKILATDLVFTPEGRKALVELAKIQTEQQNYAEAIRNYRRFLVVDADAGKRCNTMFMIGFIYDEYLDKPDMAEVNYKWVLKNTPDCELADDAEFMMSHLGEEMASVDELQAEVKRQGKKVEADAGDGEAAISVEKSQDKD